VDDHDRIAPRLPGRPHDLESFTLLRAVVLIVLVATALTVVSGLLVRIANPAAFEDYGEGLWFSVVTVATVGFGDVVPTNASGKLITILVMLFSMALFPVLAGLASAALVARNQRRVDAARLAETDARHAELLARHEHLLERLAALEDRLIPLDGGGAPEPPAGPGR
jgi:voltage-gated potassium channel